MTTAHRIVLLVLLLALVACSAPEGEREYVADGVEVTTLYSSNLGLSEVYRFVDKEAGIACWIFVSSYKGGISCLPLSETALDR